QFDIASRASLRASRAWFDRLGTELRSKLRDLSSSDFFGMAAFPFKSGDQLYLSGAARLPGGAEQETSLSSFQRGRATGERPDSFEPQLGSSGLAFLGFGRNTGLLRSLDQCNQLRSVPSQRRRSLSLLPDASDKKGATL